MRDAFGGVINLAVIVVFITLVSGFLAFNVNYTKAFRVKNKIISTLEQYKSKDNNYGNRTIKEYMQKIGYVSQNNCMPGYSFENNYCVDEVYVNVDDAGKAIGVDGVIKYYYRVDVPILIDIPVLNKFLPKINLFHIYGSTKILTK